MSLFMISRYCASLHKKARAEDGKKRTTDETLVVKEVEKFRTKMDLVMGFVMFAFCFMFALVTYRHISLSREARDGARDGLYASPPTNRTSPFAQ